MLAGRMRYKIDVWRRIVSSLEPGVPRGDFIKAFSTRASFKQTPGVKAIEAGIAEDQSRALLRVYDCAQNRTITAADRIAIEGREWSIETVSSPDRFRRHIEIVAVRKLGG